MTPTDERPKNNAWCFHCMKPVNKDDHDYSHRSTASVGALLEAIAWVEDNRPDSGERGPRLSEAQLQGDPLALAILNLINTARHAGYQKAVNRIVSDAGRSDAECNRLVNEDAEQVWERLADRPSSTEVGEQGADPDDWTTWDCTCGLTLPGGCETCRPDPSTSREGPSARKLIKSQTCKNGHACRCRFDDVFQMSGDCCAHGEVECAAPTKAEGEDITREISRLSSEKDVLDRKAWKAPDLFDRGYYSGHADGLRDGIRALQRLRTTRTEEKDMNEDCEILAMAKATVVETASGAIGIVIPYEMTAPVRDEEVGAEIEVEIVRRRQPTDDGSTEDA